MPAKKTPPPASAPADNPASIASALLECAKALRSIALSIERLGANGASGPMGAVEFLAVQVKDGIKDAGDTIADALRNKD